MLNNLLRIVGFSRRMKYICLKYYFNPILQVTSSDTEAEVKSQMTTILCDSFSSVRKHLNSVACLPFSDAVANKSPFPSESPDKSRTTVLLEHYSELLIEMVTQKLQLQN